MKQRPGNSMVRRATVTRILVAEIHRQIAPTSSMQTLEASQVHQCQANSPNAKVTGQPNRESSSASPFRGAYHEHQISLTSRTQPHDALKRINV